MLTHVQTSNPNAKSAQGTQQRAKQMQQIERLLRKNEYQKLLLERKMAVTQKKQE
jgi:hypothetical protein